MIIAECGQNHCGDMNLAKELIDLAHDNGADLCKFQLYEHAKIYKDHPEIPNVELSFDQAKMLFEYGKRVGIEVFFSVFDVEKVKWCEEIGVKRYKLAFGQRDNAFLIATITRTNKQLMISDDTRRAYFTLYAVPLYPARLDEYKLSDWIWCDGVSDHTVGLGVAKIVLAHGMPVEKHFAIDHHTGVDAEWSMTPTELAELKRFETICRAVL